MNKYLYCSKCKEYPDAIVEVYHHVEEVRRWNGDGIYELEHSSLDQADEVICAECETKLTTPES